jgi:uncharacterized protein YdeI (YjbR/CyaY-like superfamily)
LTAPANVAKLVAMPAFTGRLEAGRGGGAYVVLPEDLAAALATDEPAATAFGRLSFSHRREYTEWIAGAKRPETRARRVTETLARLRASAVER